MPRQPNGDKMKWKEAVDNKGVKKSSSKSEIKRRDSIKSTSSQTEIKRTSSSKSVPVRKDSIKSPNEFLAKVTCWQQRVDPEIEVNLDKKRKQRPVSIAGDADSLNLLQVGNLKRTLSMNSLAIAEDGVIYVFPSAFELCLRISMLDRLNLFRPRFICFHCFRVLC